VTQPPDTSLERQRFLDQAFNRDFFDEVLVEIEGKGLLVGMDLSANILPGQTFADIVEAPVQLDGPINSRN